MEQPPTEITVALTAAVSDALDTPVEELSPLSAAVDLDALDAIVTDHPAEDVTVAFTYDGLHVLVHSRGTVYARPIEGGRVGPVDAPSTLER